MIQPKFSWNEYFSDSPETTLSGQINSRQTPSGSSVYVSNCLFNQLTTGDSAGALYCTSATSFLIESSSFFSCKASLSRGAINFDNNDAQSVLYGVCGHDCCLTKSNNFQFAYRGVNNDVSSKNCVNYSSIIRCVNGLSTSYILYLKYGKICCPSVNSSMNKCQYHSGITCYSSIDSSSFTCSFRNYLFSSNNAFGCICFCIDNNA